MYGVIGSTVILGLLYVQIIKRFDVKTFSGDQIEFTPKTHGVLRYLIGGIIFGLGWSVTGACPGPMFVLLGNGIWTIIFVIIGSVIGTFLYGILRHRLPH